MKYLALLFLLMASAASAQSVTIPFTMNDDGMMVVQGSINNKPLVLLVDTGASAVFVQEHVPIPKGTPIGHGHVYGVDGGQDVKEFQADVCVQTACRRTVVIEAPKKPHISDCLSLGFFSQFGKMTIDFDAKTITLEERK